MLCDDRHLKALGLSSRSNYICTGTVHVDLQCVCTCTVHYALYVHKGMVGPWISRPPDHEDRFWSVGLSRFHFFKMSLKEVVRTFGALASTPFGEKRRHCSSAESSPSAPSPSLPSLTKHKFAGDSNADAGSGSENLEACGNITPHMEPERQSDDACSAPVAQVSCFESASVIDIDELVCRFQTCMGALLDERMSAITNSLLDIREEVRALQGAHRKLGCTVETVQQAQSALEDTVRAVTRL